MNGLPSRPHFRGNASPGQSHGALWVEGGIYRYALPRSHGPGIGQADSRPPPGEKGNRMGKVLLVDDERDLAEACAISLSQAGYAVSVAHDGAEALTILTAKTFDLVITDLRMPRLDGFTVLRWIMSNKPSTKVIILTAFGSPTVTETAKRLGALHCLSKPVNRDRLLETVASVVGESGFSANIQNITVTDYVQLCLYTGKTSTLEVSSGRKKGTIAVVEGAITYAEHEDLKGERAFFEIISWEGGQINEMKLSAPLTPNVHTGSQSLLLEALRLKDEIGRPRQPEAGLPDKESPPLAGTAPAFERSPAPRPIQGADQSTDAQGRPDVETASDLAADPSGLDRLSRMLNQDAQVVEYGIFVEQDFLRYKRSVTGAILSAAPSLYLKLGDSLKEKLRCGALRYLLIHTAGGVRYMVFDYLNARGVIGLRPGARPQELWEKLCRR